MRSCSDTDINPNLSKTLKQKLKKKHETGVILSLMTRYSSQMLLSSVREGNLMESFDSIVNHSTDYQQRRCK